MSPPESKGEFSKTWLSLSEVAEYLGISRKTIQRLPLPRTALGRLPRFSRQAIGSYLTERQQTPATTPPVKLWVSTPRLSNIGRGLRPRGLAKADRANHLLKLLND